jgi:hypothetical protein
VKQTNKQQQHPEGNKNRKEKERKIELALWFRNSLDTTVERNEV